MKPKTYSFQVHSINTDTIDPNALHIIKVLKKFNHTAYIVGGSVRDLLLKATPKDFDISTSARPEEIKEIFKNCILVGKRFRLAHIRFGKYFIEVSTFRSGDTSNDNLITKDNIWGTEEEDVLRRDFTINGLFLDPFSNTIIDYTGGFEDIKTRTLKTIGNPLLRFRQDPVRMIRMLKILARFEFRMEPNILEALAACRKDIVKSSSIRIFEEILKMLSSGSSSLFFDLLMASDMLRFLLPELHYAFSSFPEIKDLTLLHLAVLDRFIEKNIVITSKSFLLAVLVYPLLEQKVKNFFSCSSEECISLNLILEKSQEFIKDFFSNSFVGCPKKILTSIFLILNNQYKLSLLQLGKNKIYTPKAKSSSQSHFKLSLLLLKIRTFVNPDLLETYNTWIKNLK